MSLHSEAAIQCDAVAVLDREADTYKLTLALPDNEDYQWESPDPIKLQRKATEAAQERGVTVNVVNDADVSLKEWLCREEIGGIVGLLGLYKAYIFVTIFGVGIPLRLFVDLPPIAVPALGAIFLLATVFHFFYWPIFNALNDEYHVRGFHGEHVIRKETLADECR